VPFLDMWIIVQIFTVSKGVPFQRTRWMWTPLFRMGKFCLRKP